MNTTQLATDREREIQKYVEAYTSKTIKYGMGQSRREAATKHLKGMPARGTLLDVGCGRGEMVRIAKSLGYNAQGVDPATHQLYSDIDYALAHDLPFPDNSFDWVTCFDVMEHLLEGDHVPALEEFGRVGGKVIVAAADFDHNSHGVHYHISFRPAEEWRALFDSVFSHVELLPRHGGITPTWLMWS